MEFETKVGIVYSPIEFTGLGGDERLVVALDIRIGKSTLGTSETVVRWESVGGRRRRRVGPSESPRGFRVSSALDGGKKPEQSGRGGDIRAATVEAAEPLKRTK
ncbi:hypothetical protein [Halogeometricum luteum]|uniref:Uncharacterized protein n=1 Tax=Halogeometricum luteum TaxID=2950537 RepID=A0ABU2FVW5_9EURY|nr:hypothetical protein [Halogeometricum sp. S3BR5-2]MDS0292672.1 hypothetical protein [Halogeometricum sp. S3BR5-2]